MSISKHLHDARKPLNRISMKAECLKLGADQSDTTLLSELNDIIQECQSCSNILAEIGGSSSQVEANSSLAIDRFIGHLSHELRTPLSAILGYTELLLSNAEFEQAQPELAVINNNGKHLLSLLNDMLDLSKINANKLEVNEQKVSLFELVDDVYATMQVPALDKGLSFSVNALGKLPEHILTDELRLKQIMVNLVHNAIKFTDNGSVTIHLTYKDNALSIKVEDTGCGIAPEQQQQIFQPFEQLEDIVNRRTGGAGLGLAISQSLITRIGGSLTLHSDVQEGSVFSLYLPAHRCLQPLSYYKPAHQQSLARSSTPSLSGQVLVVDDLIDIRNLLSYLITSTGALCSTAENGKQAVELVATKVAQQQHYSLILIDLHMPEMDGRSAISKIRAMNYHAPVIAMTAAMQQNVHAELMALGFDDVLAKPISKVQLWRELSKYLEPHNQDKIPRVAPESANLIQHYGKNEQIAVLVEDDEDTANMLRKLLSSLGVETFVMSSGQECLQANLYLQRASLVFVDLGLPDMHGLELIKQIAPKIKDQALYILSGERVEQGQLVGLPVKACLLKPISLKTLASIVSQ